MEPTPQQQGRKKRQRGKATGAAKQAAAVAEARDPAMYAQRLLGKSLREIAEQFGVDVSTVSRACDRAMADERESIEVHREMQVGRVKEVYKALMPKVAEGDTDAVRALMQTEKRLADLLGLDAAKKHEVTGEGGRPLVPVQVFQAWLTKPEPSKS